MNTQPQVSAFFDPPTNTFTYLVRDPSSDACAIIDSVLAFDYSSGRTDTRAADELIAHIREAGLQVQWILETHAHADHLSAAPYLQEQLGGKIGIGEHIIKVQQIFGKVFNAGTEFARDGSQFDALFADGDTFSIGNLGVKVLHTPGCLSYLIGDAVFVGDTLFMPDYGTARCDFPGGDSATLYQSVQKLLALPDETRMYLCHDYLPEGRSHYVHETTVGEQRRRNIHIHEGVSEADFVVLRDARDATLSAPKLLIPSVQVNIRAGHLPEPEDNGQVYLKVPVNLL